jgi:hypothetical protein
VVFVASPPDDEELVVVGTMAQQLWEQVRPRSDYERFLYRAGAALIAAGLLHVGMLIADPGPWHGPVSWRKPVVFGVSFGLTAWGVGWVLGRLRTRRRLGWAVSGALGGASVVEVGAITIQRWRGVPSHFNDATPFDAAMFGMMGVSVALVAAAIVAALVWAVVGLRTDPVIWWAAVVGLASIVAASRIGVDMIGAGEAALEATGQVPVSVVFGAAGSAKLAHAVGMHGIHVLGALAIVLRLGRSPATRQRWIMRLAAAAHTGLFVVVASQAYAGLPLRDLPAASVAVALVAVVVLVSSAASAVRSWRAATPRSVAAVA